jgi:hypothetical protein
MLSNKTKYALKLLYSSRSKEDHVSKRVKLLKQPIFLKVLINFIGFKA